MPKPPDINLLVVDDHEDNLGALQDLLEQPGRRVLTARSGTEALELLLKHDVALALVDVYMPSMDGFELAELMRETERTSLVPIIFMTGATEEWRVFKGYEAGAVDYLFKPLDARLLRSKVDIFVQLHQQSHTLSTQLAQLRQMLALSDMFIAVLGHDLRNPLQSIELAAQLVRVRAQDPASVTRSADTIRQASKRMARLIDQLLDFARARVQGSIPITPVPCDLSELTRQVITELEPEAAQRTAIVTRADVRGMWDRDRLLQVAANLLGNAATHGSPDGVIEVELAAEGGAVQLSVKNQGHIPDDVLPSVFDPFRRSADPSRPRKGLGLGLYIVDQIVRAHGGHVEVSSNVRDGTTFRVELPRAPIAG